MGIKTGVFYQGDNQRWRVSWPVDITGAVIKFRMARGFDQPTADLEITATLDAPDGDGKIFGATLEVSDADAAKLTPARYETQHKIVTAAGDDGTFLDKRITVKAVVPAGA